MKLALIYHQFVPRGGLEGYLMEFCVRLQKEGHQLTLVTAEVPDSLAQTLEAKVHKIEVMKGLSIVRMWQFEKQAARLTARDLGVDFTLGFGRTTTHDLHRAGGGCHAVYSRLLPSLKRWGPKNLLELQLERQLYTGGGTKRFVVNSSQVAREIQENYGTDPASFRVIHTAVDNERFKPPSDRDTLRRKIAEKIGSDPDRPACLFVSLNHRRKGLDALLKAWQGVDADLWIVGKALDTRYRALVEGFKLKNRVFAMDARSDVSLLYQAADWFVHPTLYDACANTVMQSMSCELPGLISVNDGAVDFIQNGTNGFLMKEPQNHEALQQDINKALSLSEAERLHLGRTARQTMLPLTWEAHIQKWMKAISELQ